MAVSTESLTSSRRTHGAPASPAGRILILNNPGTFTRNYLQDMATAAGRLGLQPVTIELGEIWGLQQQGRHVDPKELAEKLGGLNIRAAIASGYNGTFEWPAVRHATGRAVPLFEQLGIPHIQWWTDHPQWAQERIAQRVELQPMFRSPNHHVFVKSELAADEIRDILKWPNVYGLPVAEDADRMKPAAGVTPDFDVVTIVGSPPMLDPDLLPFLDHDDPDDAAIHEVIACKVREQLAALWEQHAPKELLSELSVFGQEWTALRAAEPRTGSYRIFRRLAPQFPQSAAWLRHESRVYFDAIHILWDFGRWQRTFVTLYLAKHFRVGVFGYDWSSVGLGGAPRVDHDAQPAVYARGKVALNISQCNDEEGIAHKPFQIAAGGVAMLHIDRHGLSDCFTPGEEVLAFRSPREAREAVTMLLDDPARRSAMASAARQRVLRDHTWDVRLPQLLAKAGVCKSMVNA